MTDYGIKISQDGYGVGTAADRELLLSSKFPFLKTFAQGEVAFSVTGTGQYEQDITHNFGYYPAYVHYNVTQFLGAERQIGGFRAEGTSSYQSIESYVGTSILKLAYYSEGLSYPFTVRLYYYLFYDKIA